jgi:hypothetical protein
MWHRASAGRSIVTAARAENAKRAPHNGSPSHSTRSKWAQDAERYEQAIRLRDRDARIDGAYWRSFAAS